VPPEPPSRFRPATHALWQRLTTIERADRPHAVASWLRELRPDIGDDRLRLVLLDAAHAVAVACHRDEGTSACGCATVAWSSVAALTSSDSDPRIAFLQWLQSWLTQIDRDHPERPAERAAALIRARPDQRWSPGALSTRVGEPRRQLTRMFGRTFGVSISDYVHLVRIERAVRLVAEAAKIEAVAREVGYRSKKDFYAAMQRWAGVTPARLRAWTAGDRAGLAQRLSNIARRGIGSDTSVRGAQRRLRLARTISRASVPATRAAPPTRATPA
jgi:AraC-like DNA-binding protein